MAFNPKNELHQFLKSKGISYPVCGCDIGKGWDSIVIKLVDQLIASGWNKDLHQIKEKFGCLRFYTGTITDEMNKFIREAEESSSKTCEKCGRPGQLRGTNWMLTLCNECGKNKPLIE